MLHYEYLEWPDYYVPFSTRSVRELIRALFNIPPQVGPFVVHCRYVLFFLYRLYYLSRTNCELPTSLSILQFGYCACVKSVSPALNLYPRIPCKRSLFTWAGAPKCLPGKAYSILNTSLFIYCVLFLCLQCWHRKNRNLLHDWSHPSSSSLWRLGSSRYWKHGATVQIAAWWDGANQGKIHVFVLFHVYSIDFFVIVDLSRRRFSAGDLLCNCHPNRNNIDSSMTLLFKSLRTTSALGWDQRVLCSPEVLHVTFESNHCSTNSNQSFLFKVFYFYG